MAYWTEIRDLIAERAAPRSEPVVLADGAETYEYLDLKGLFTTGTLLFRLAYEMCESIHELGLHFNAVGGPTMGADFISHSVAYELMSRRNPVEWFTVRSTIKDHGLQRWVEGAQLNENSKVILTDDVVSTGNSLFKAFRQVEDTGAEIVAVMPLVDRGARFGSLFWGIPYHPLFTHEDLGIDPL